MKEQIGGLKLKNPKKTGFTPVYDMINSPGCSINLLTYQSLKGFMLYINVLNDHSEYVDRHNDNGRFTKSVTSFILKFAVISPYNDTPLPYFNDVTKSSESKNSYFEEAKLQQQIWKKSISGGRPAICPSVANFSLFDNGNSKNLLQFLETKLTRDSEVFSVIDYLKLSLGEERKYGIGVISMPKVENSMTLGKFIRLSSRSLFFGIAVTPEIKDNVYASVLSKVARLFIEIGIIHFDLHSSNALVYKTDDDEIDSVIIDFGRASDITNETKDIYFKTVREKEVINDMKSDLYNKIFSIKSNAKNKVKVDYIEEVLNFIAFKDNEINQQLFRFDDPGHFQMSWYKNVMGNNSVMIKTFNLLKQSIELNVDRSSTASTTISNYESKGNFVNFKKGVSSFIVPFTSEYISASSEASSSASEEASSSASEEYPCDDNSKSCVISGGKRHTRNIIKNRKTRKNKIIQVSTPKIGN